MGLCAHTLVATLAVVAIMYVGIGHESQYVFSAAKMQEIAKAAIAEHPDGPSSAVISAVVAKLNAAYPDYIIPEPQWMFNNAVWEFAFSCLHRFISPGTRAVLWGQCWYCTALSQASASVALYYPTCWAAWGLL